MWTKEPAKKKRCRVPGCLAETYLTDCSWWMVPLPQTSPTVYEDVCGGHGLGRGELDSALALLGVCVSK